ncbi:MAG: EAL domain-containing protein [Gammaproteobacteria bacterium]|nr:EAL domain-containing protein [Gammaproteobacteria bacterium]
MQRSFGIKTITGIGMAFLASLAFVLAWYSSHSYQQLVQENQQQVHAEQLKSKTLERIEELYLLQKQFAYRLQNEEAFKTGFAKGDERRVREWLQHSFGRVYASRGLLHFKSILIRDLDNEIFTAVYEDPLNPYSGCPLVLDQVFNSHGSERLKPKYGLCSFQGDLLAEVVVSIGSLQPKAFLHVVAYVKSELQGLDETIQQPIQLKNAESFDLYRSDDWPGQDATKQPFEEVSFTVFGDDNVPGLIVSSLYDPAHFDQQIDHTNLNILIVAVVATLLVLILVFILVNMAFKPVDRIRNSVGALLNGRYAPIETNHLPAELDELVTAYNQMVRGWEDASEKREQAEKDLLNERDFISTTLDSITNAVLVVNSQMLIKLANPAAEDMLNESKENLIDYPLDELVIMYTNRSASHIANLKMLLKTPNQLINLFYQVDDKTVELEMMASPMIDKESDDVGHVLIFKDVTEDRKLRRKLNYEGRHDKLTSFLNRTAFENKFYAMVNDSDYTQNQHIMVYLNLDQFKIVNDTCGSQAGDQLLKQVADTIQQNVRKSDLLARLGGDEFGILFPYAQSDAAANTINDILLYIHQNGFNWNERNFTITASAALIPFGLASDDYSAKLSKLTTARYLARENGGNQYYLIDDEDEKVKEHHSSMGWASGINKGFSEQRFKLYAQPIVPLNQKENKRHFEILIRYQDEDDTIIRPNEFLAPAERFNLIEKIDRWVVSEVVHWMIKHPEVSKDLFFSVNLSGRSIGSTSFHRFLEQLLQTDLIDPKRLCFEITETAAVKDVEKSIEFIRMIKKLGAKFSLDDFGSGLSSFTYLKQFPVDYLKIDGVFIKDILHDAQSYDFVRSITEVGHCLGMKVIAEFVESKNMFHMLREAKVDYLQGYTIGEPEPIELINLQKVAEQDS